MNTNEQNDGGEIATPRTDFHLIDCIGSKVMVDCDFARTLERELHQANSQIESLKQEVIEWRDDRQKVNADLNEELANMKEQSNKKSEIVEELVALMEAALENTRNLMFELHSKNIISAHGRTAINQIKEALSRAANP